MSGKKDRGGELDRFALSEIVPSPRDFIFFDAEKCTGCTGCVVICPMDLWKMREGRARLEPDYREKCMECGSCFIACESGAIDFTYHPGRSGVVYRFA